MKLIDVHVYYGKWIYPILKNDIKTLLNRMDTMKTEKAIIMSALAMNYDMEGGNAEIASIIAENPRLYGYVYVNPNYPDKSIAQINKYLSDKKFVGVKFHPEYTRIPFDSHVNQCLFDCIEKFNKPINVHTWPHAEHGGDKPCGTPEIIARVAKNRPGLKILAGHMGGPAWREMVHIAKDINNLWVDHCSSWADVDKVGFAIKELGADKVLFGTGMMQGNGISQLGIIKDAEITEEEKHKWCYQNAMELFKLT